MEPAPVADEAFILTKNPPDKHDLFQVAYWISLHVEPIDHGTTRNAFEAVDIE
jgi:hypothetical protein